MKKNEAGRGDQEWGWGCPTLHRGVRDRLFGAQQNNNGAEEQSQVTFWGKGAGSGGHKNKSQMQRLEGRSMLLKTSIKASDQHKIISTVKIPAKEESGLITS